jgi:alkylation response protein AidB-like acyl-CoA dehydrogenase
MGNQTIADLLGAVESVGPLIAEHAARAEADRQLSGSVYQAMYNAGLFGMLAPKAYRGLELHPTDCIQIWEKIARIDPAAAWNLVMNQVIAAYSAWLPPKGVAEFFADGIPTAAGAFHPLGKATPVDGGWRITGQVPFASGCHHVKWLGMAVQQEDGDTPFGAFFRREAAAIPDTWHTLGMRGTGSADFAVTDLFVPEHLTVPIAPLNNPPPGFEGPLFRMWPWPGIVGEAAISVGIAAAAVDTAVHLCITKTPAYQGTALRDQQLAQFLIGKARARVEASRDTVTRAAEFGYQDVEQSGKSLSPQAKIRLQLAVSFAAEACAEAVRLVNDVVGTSSIRLGQPFERHFRDTHTLLQHSDKSGPRYASAGRLMFGLDNDWVWLSF